MHDFQVDGTTTTVNSTTMTVDDKNLELGTGAANDAAANGGGITIVSGEGNKTFQFEATGDNLGSSENLNIASGKVYKINNVETLSATTLGANVVNSSLTNVGTLTGLSVNGTASVTGQITAGDLRNSSDGLIPLVGVFQPWILSLLACTNSLIAISTSKCVSPSKTWSSIGVFE